MHKVRTISNYSFLQAYIVVCRHAEQLGFSKTISVICSYKQKPFYRKTKTIYRKRSCIVGLVVIDNWTTELVIHIKY